MTGIDSKPLEIEQRPSRRLDWIDGIRALCALNVVVQHFKGPSFGLGYYAVIVFMVVSGFCLMIPIASSAELPVQYWSFMKRRAIRILPPYYVALLLCVAVDLWTGLLGGGMSKFIRDVEGHVLIVHDLNIPGFLMTIDSICSPMWSIALEWHVYFMFPLYVLLFRKCGALKSTVFIMLAWYAVEQWTNYFPIGFTRVYFYWFFSLGMLAAFVVFSPMPEAPRLRKIPWGPITITTLISSGVGIYLHAGDNDAFNLTDSLVALFASALIVWLALHESAVKHVLSTPLLAWIGSWSYSLYLTHYLFLAIQLRIFPHIPPMYFVPVSLAFAYLFYLAIERPFVNRRHKYKLVSDEAVTAV